MILGMTSAVQAGLRQQHKFEITSNHLANVNTTGFKGEILSFDDMFRATLTTDFTQGDIQVTDNRLDVALADEGFFKVETPLGIRYTRDGAFTVDMEGQLVNQRGDVVQGEGGPIVIQGREVNITGEGDVQVDGEIVGRIAVVTFDDPENLRKEGANLFVHTAEAPGEVPPPSVSVVQGALEKPNVNVVSEMTDMIETHRLFEAYTKLIQAIDETDTRAVTEVGRTI